MKIIENLNIRKRNKVLDDIGGEWEKTGIRAHVWSSISAVVDNCNRYLHKCPKKLCFGY